MNKTTAWLCSDVGAQPQLSEVELPEVAPADVLLRVTATGLNFADLLMIEGRYQATPPPPFVLGMEVAGVIMAVGQDVENLAAGDRVMGVPGHGGLAKHVIMPASSLRPIKPEMDDVTAAGFQIAYGTSHLALTHRARLRNTETLLVLGASGGVGLTAVEVGRQIGARVIAVARGQDKLAVARTAGADLLVDSDDADLLGRLRSLGPIDVVYDAIGGDIGEAALRVMAPDGRFLVIGFASGRLPEIKPNHLLVKNQTVIGFYWGGYQNFNPRALDASMSELSNWHAQGRIRPHVSHVLPFEDALQGLELLRSRKSTGKVVIAQT